VVRIVAPGPKRFATSSIAKTDVPAGAAGEDALLAREPRARQERVAVGDAHVLVDDRRVEARGNVSLPIPSTRYGWTGPPE
jgi:hypothetical protein